jgi:hypothetical protein
MPKILIEAVESKRFSIFCACRLFCACADSKLVLFLFLAEMQNILHSTGYCTESLKNVFSLTFTNILIITLYFDLVVALSKLRAIAFRTR